MSGTLSNSGFDAVIDPGVAFMWLPNEVCDAFESTFGLVFNSTTQLYIINQVSHAKNIADQSYFNFTLCNRKDSCSEFRFPYADFALNASSPLMPASEIQTYFPIRRANSSNQFTLGRAFLQETHLFADWDNRWFNISQARFDESNQQVITVVGPGYISDYSANKNQSRNLSGGTVAGITTGIIAFLLVLLAGSTFLSWRRKSWPFQHPKPPPSESFTKAELDNTVRPWVELSEVERIEMQAVEPPKEFPEEEQNAELPGCIPVYELPANDQARSEQR